LNNTNNNVLTATGTSGVINGEPNFTFNELTNVMNVTGSGAINAPTSGTSGATIFNVNGVSGQLFNIKDTFSGSLFSVNDISGIPVLEAFSDSTVLMGNYVAPALNTTAKSSAGVGSTTVYTIPMATYTGAFVEYVVYDGTNYRAGNIISVFDGTSLVYTETSTADIGTTTGISMLLVRSGSDALVRATVTSGTWTVKTIIRSI